MGIAHSGACVHERQGTSGLRQTWEVATSPDCRGLRVMILLAATFLMGTADLALTLTYVTSMGMVELNPLARFIMAWGSVELLAVFKFGAMTVNGGILFAFRRRRISEVATWICFAVMVALSIKWAMYASHMTNFATQMHTADMAADARFVMMHDE